VRSKVRILDCTCFVRYVCAEFVWWPSSVRIVRELCVSFVVKMCVWYLVRNLRLGLVNFSIGTVLAWGSHLNISCPRKQRLSLVSIAGIMVIVPLKLVPDSNEVSF
jgi:hypothetical protein